MEWASDDAGERYTRTRNGYQATVWRDMAGGWEASVSRAGIAVTTNTFTTLEEAWSWCEQQLAARAATDLGHD